MCLTSDKIVNIRNKNKDIIKASTDRYIKFLCKDEIILCVDFAIWRCLTKANEENFKSFLYKEIEWECKKAMIKNKTELVCLDDLNSFEQEVENENSYFMDRDINVLSDRQKRIIIGKFYNGKTLDTIGKEEGCSRQRIHQIIKAALKKVQENTIKNT